VAETAAAVTDTHPLLFHAAGTGRLGRDATRLYERCESREAIVYVPMAVVWETSLLARVRRVDLRRSVQAFFDDLFSNPAYQPLELTPDQVYAADGLGFTRDPFDGLIVAAAVSLNLPLVTRDAAIRGSGTVKIVW
jgi:PIN domain nuclease of toxin-antitoxin system